MFPFFLGKKTDEGREFTIKEIPLFSNLSGSEIRFLEKKIRLVEYKKNEIVYHQGTDPDAFYVIYSGRFRVFLRSLYGVEKTLTYIYRGDYFGEISILTGKPHSVSVEAINDALVFKVDKGDFNELLKNVPSLALHLSRSLGMKLRDESKEQIGQAQIVSIYNLKEGMGQTTFVVNLAVSLQRELKKPILYLDMNSDGKAREDLLGSGGEFRVLYFDETDVTKESEITKYIFDTPAGVKLLNIQEGIRRGFHEKKLTSLLSYLISRFHFVLIDLPREINEMVFKVLSQSDLIYILTDGETEDLDKCRSIISEMKKTFTFEPAQIRLLLSEAGGSDHSSITMVEKLVDHKVFSVLPYCPELQEKTVETKGASSFTIRAPDAPYSRIIRYLAREVSGRLVGLVLGSGAAHGMAHIGVIKALEDAQIPIDIVAGASMGALVGVLWCAGYSAQEIGKIANSLDKKSSFFNLIGFSDFSLAHQGFFKGRMIVRFLRSLLGHKTFQDLGRPMKVVATNLFTAEEVVFEEGDLVEAIRASISIPGIFRPHPINGKSLIDGGVIDPVPVKVLTRLGVKKIIAVNVLSGPHDILKRREILKQQTDAMAKKMKDAGWFARWFHELRCRMERRYSTNIFNVLMNTIQFMEYSIASTATTEADVVIHPVIYDANWIEFYAAEKFMKIGEEKAREQLSEIQKLVEL